MKKFVYFIPFCVILFLTIGFSAFEKTLLVDNVDVVVRPEKNIRVTNLESPVGSNNGLSVDMDYNVSNINGSVNLPNSNSSVKYTVTVTNIGNVDIGILNTVAYVNGNANVLEAVIDTNDYVEGDKLCNAGNVCNGGISKTFDVTISYKSGASVVNGNIDFIVEFDFEEYYTINYVGFDSVSGLPTGILANQTKEVVFTSSTGIPNGVSVSGAVSSYDNATLTLSNATDNVTVTNASVEVIDNGDGTTTTITESTTENEDGSTTTTITEVTTDENGDVTSSSETETTTTENEDGSSTSTSTTTNYDSNGDVTSTSETQTTTNDDGSSTSTTTNYDENGDATGRTTNEVDTSGNSTTQETTIVNGNEVVTGYTIDTSENESGGFTVESGTGVDSGVLALDGNPFTIHLVANVAINKSTSGTNGNGGRVIVSALEPTSNGATTYKGFAFFVEKSNNKVTLYASSSASVKTGNSGATWGSKLSNCSVTASNTTYTQHTIDITYTPGTGNSGGTIRLTLDGTSASVTSTTIPSALSNATISVGTLGVEHTRDITAMEIIEFSVSKTIS